MTTTERPERVSIDRLALVEQLEGEELAAAVAREVMGWQQVWACGKFACEHWIDCGSPIRFSTGERAAAACAEHNRAAGTQHEPIALWVDENGNEQSAAHFWRPDRDMNAAWDMIRWLGRLHLSLMDLTGLFRIFLRIEHYRRFQCTADDDAMVLLHALPTDLCRAALAAKRMAEECRR